MPILLLLLFVGFLLLLAIALLPLSLLQRYRVGTARRPARGWVTALNLAAISLSAVLLLTSAAITNVWVPHAFAATGAGFGAGCVVGLAGLALTRWEPSREGLHFTPNRLLVLIITLLVTARVLYGFWRTWQAWSAGLDQASWVAASGLAGSMGAGAIVLGYYFTFWIGVRRRFRRHRDLTAGVRSR